MSEEFLEEVTTDLFGAYGDPTRKGLQRSDFRSHVERVLAALPFQTESCSHFLLCHRTWREQHRGDFATV